MEGGPREEMALYNPFEQTHFSEAGTRLAFLPGGAVRPAWPNLGAYLMSIMSLTRKEYEDLEKKCLGCGLKHGTFGCVDEDFPEDDPDGDEGEDSDPFAESDEDHEDLPEH